MNVTEITECGTLNVGDLTWIQMGVEVYKSLEDLVSVIRETKST